MLIYDRLFGGIWSAFLLMRRVFYRFVRTTPAKRCVRSTFTRKITWVLPLNPQTFFKTISADPGTSRFFCLDASFVPGQSVPPNSLFGVNG